MAPVGAARTSRVGGIAIPGKDLLHAHYDFSEYDASTTSNIPDLTGNGYSLDQGGISGYGSINGVQAGQFDGTGDELYGATFSDLRPDASVFVVFEADTGSGFGSSDRHYLVQTEQTDAAGVQWFEGNWLSYYGTVVAGSNNAATNLIGTTLPDSADDTLREDGVETATGDFGSRHIDAINLGSQNAASNSVESRYYAGLIGEVLVYDGLPNVSDVEQYLSNKWSLGI